MDSFQSFFCVAIGFAVAGSIAHGYALVVSRPLSFRVLMGDRSEGVVAVPFLVFGAPFVIMRNILRAPKDEKPRADLVAIATVVAGFWSLMSGAVVILSLRSLGVLVI